MKREVDVAIVGAGSAGLSALRQVREWTDSYLLIDHGALGTTCARVGCMPSKALLQVANDFHRRLGLAEKGITGAAQEACDIPAVLRHVRKLRDRFTSGMIEDTRELAGENLVEGKAELLGPDTLSVDGTKISARRIVIAAGARPIVPRAWQALGGRVLTSSTFFEQEDLSPRMAVIGLGPIGLELGQALSRLGVRVAGFSLDPTIGGLTDPEVKAAAIGIFQQEFPLQLGEPAEVSEEGDELEVKAGSTAMRADAILAAMGVQPALEGLGIERLGVQLDAKGVPRCDPRTMQIGDLPVYFAGDFNGCRPILHEALDEGLIAGRNAHEPGDARCYCRRTPLRIVFSDPQIAVVGRSWEELRNLDTVTGAMKFEEQSRAVLEGRNHGLMHVYAERATGNVLGAELVGPDAEHLAHLLALSIEAGLSVFDVLRMPFYHPTAEEGLRTALQEIARSLPPGQRPRVPTLCESCTEPPLS